MIGVNELVDDVVGREFEIECSNIALRGRDDSIERYFAGPGSISGGVTGRFTFRAHNTIEKDPKEFLELFNATHRSSLPMCFDATDYHGRKWTGGWFHPIIVGSGPSECYVTGEFPQLHTEFPLTTFDNFRNSTVNHYAGDLRLPMLEVTNIQRMRGDKVEQLSSDWDRTELDFDGASVVVQTEAEDDRTIISTTHMDGWQPPYCEIGLADALSFVCATTARPRITIRYFEDRATLFIRETPSVRRSQMPRPIAHRGPRDRAFWNLFLAFLRDCKAKKDFDSTPLSRLFSELVFASTGTLHVFVLSLVVGVDDIVEQIIGRGQPVAAIDNLKRYINEWPGDPHLRESAIKVVSSNLSRTSTPQHLRQLAAQGVVTSEQIRIWGDLRPRLAHGKVANYDEELWAKRNQLIMMSYRLALRLLNYRGEMTDYATAQPGSFDFQWAG